MSLAPNFFERGDRAPPEFLDLHYKIQLVPDHVANSHGDRPSELEDMVAR